MKIAEGGSKKNTQRKWQSNHLLCLHWQQSVAQSLQRKSSSTAQVCKASCLLHGNKAQGYLWHIGGFIWKVSGSSPHHKTQAAVPREPAAQDDSQQLPAFKSTLPTGCWKLWKVMSAAGSGDTTAADLLRQKGVLSNCLDATYNFLSYTAICSVRDFLKSYGVFWGGTMRRWCLL